MESILTSIKKLLSVAEDYTHFDDDIIIHINTVFMDLTGLKVGPSSGFIITDKSAVWTDFVSNPLRLAAIKSYMYLRVKLLFDPPTNASLLNSMQQQIEKFEWLINVAAENDRSGIVDDNVSEEIKALITELESENETLKSLNTELTATNATLTANNSSLTSKVSSLEKSNASLQNSVDILTDANDALQVDNADLRTANESLQTRNSDLEFQNGELSARNETLLTENESLEVANDTLLTKNAELEAENERLEASIKPAQRKTVEITENGTTEILPDNGNTLSGVDLTVNVPISGGTGELEAIIDKSGLEIEGETVTEKVEQLIDLAEWEKVWFKQSEKFANATALFQQLEAETIPRTNLITAQQFQSMCKNASIAYIDYYLNTTNGINFMDCFRDTANLKRIVGINTAKATSVIRLFTNSSIEEIDEPFNFSSITTASSQDSCFRAGSLVKIRFVPETIKCSIVFTSPVLSDESIQSIIDGLAPVENIQTLTVHSTVYEKITEEQWTIIESRNWHVE